MDNGTHDLAADNVAAGLLNYLVKWIGEIANGTFRCRVTPKVLPRTKGALAADGILPTMPSPVNPIRTPALRTPRRTSSGGYFLLSLSSPFFPHHVILRVPSQYHLTASRGQRIATSLTLLSHPHPSPICQPSGIMQHTCLGAVICSDCSISTDWKATGMVPNIT